MRRWDMKYDTCWAPVDCQSRGNDEPFPFAVPWQYPLICLSSIIHLLRVPSVGAALRLHALLGEHAATLLSRQNRQMHRPMGPLSSNPLRTFPCLSWLQRAAAQNLQQLCICTSHSGIRCFPTAPMLSEVGPFSALCKQERICRNVLSHGPS